VFAEAANDRRDLRQGLVGDGGELFELAFEKAARGLQEVGGLRRRVRKTCCRLAEALVGGGDVRRCLLDHFRETGIALGKPLDERAGLFGKACLDGAERLGGVLCTIRQSVEDCTVFGTQPFGAFARGLGDPLGGDASRFGIAGDDRQGLLVDDP